MKTFGLTMFAAVALATSALAADKGGGDYADLEERVAELEAVSVKKGNRKVSLTVSGYVTHHVMHWDDGTNKDVFIGDGGAAASRFRFLGEAKISPDLSAGFLYEFGINNNHIGSMTQGAGGDDLGGAVALRDSTVWLAHKTLGKVKIGHGSTATDNLILIDTSGAGVIASPDVGVFNGSFVAGGGLTWNHLFNGGVSFDTARRNHVMYETPVLMGFVGSAAFGEDNFFDVALRYAGEFGGVRIAGGVGYSVDEEAPAFGASGFSATKIKELKGAVSALHVASGVFATVSAGQRQIEGQNSFATCTPILIFCLPTGAGTADAKDAMYWHAMVGWQKNLSGMGNTVFYGEYQQAKDMVGSTGSWDPIPGAANAFSISSDARMWGFGVVQHVDAAAMEIFLAYKNFSGEVEAKGANGPLVDSGEPKDFQAIIGGARVSF